jgi:hypothetical protein
LSTSCSIALPLVPIRILDLQATASSLYQTENISQREPQRPESEQELEIELTLIESDSEIHELPIQFSQHMLKISLIAPTNSESIEKQSINTFLKLHDYSLIKRHYQTQS